MTDNPSTSLGARLSPLLSGGFFRPLTRPSAAVYVDCADRLAEAADEGGQIPHDEARVLIRDVLVQHPDVQLDEDEGGQFRDLNQRASQFFNKLIEVHWLEPRRVSLDEHYVLIAPALRQLLRLLRELAENRPAELKDFAATLRSLCRDLLNEGALDPNKLGAEEMRQTVKDLLDRAGRAGDRVDEAVLGDVEDVQIELGLKAHREQPRNPNRLSILGDKLRAQWQAAGLALPNANWTFPEVDGPENFNAELPPRQPRWHCPTLPSRKLDATSRVPAAAGRNPKSVAADKRGASRPPSARSLRRTGRQLFRPALAPRPWYAIRK